MLEIKLLKLLDENGLSFWPQHKDRFLNTENTNHEEKDW